MDRRERVNDPEEMLRMALDARAARIWTSLPCVVVSFNPQKQTIVAQPAVNGRVRQPDGTWLSIQMPQLVDVPVLWPGGGGVTLVFAIAAGDECLVHFSARCIDAWWAQGFAAATAGTGTGADGKPVNPQNDPPVFRMHNLSDGFASVGVRSQARVFTVDPNVCRLRTDDDSTYLEFNPTAKTLKCVFSGGIDLNGVTIDSSGNVVSPSNITADSTVIGNSDVQTGGGISLQNHVHSGVVTGGADTGPPSG
jgi:hypothetical protein